MKTVKAYYYIDAAPIAFLQTNLKLCISHSYKQGITIKLRVAYYKLLINTKL